MKIKKSEKLSTRALVTHTPGCGVVFYRSLAPTLAEACQARCQLVVSMGTPCQIAFIEYIIS